MPTSNSKPEVEILVPISLGQAERVVQQVVGNKGPGASLVRLLLALSGQDRVAMTDLRDDPRATNRLISQSVIISLLVLSVVHRGERRITDIAAELGIAPATAHRYLRTWVAVGVLEQNGLNQRYRVALRWRE